MLTTTQERLPVGASWGEVHLSVTDIERAKYFWTGYVGLEVTEGAASGADVPSGVVTVGAGGRTLIVLQPGANAPVARRRTGLYHVALHVVNRGELARVVARLFSLRYENSPTDHTMSETTYLWDPDGHGIEITLETPERGEFVSLPGGGFGARTADGRITSGRDPVDLDSLFGDLGPGEDLSAPLAGGTRIGHVHYHVADLDAARSFYAGVVGFVPEMHEPRIGMSDFSFPGVTFRHSLAINTWSGAGAPPPPEGSAALQRSTLLLPTEADLEALAGRLETAGRQFSRSGSGLELSDPSGSRLLVTVQAA